MDFLVQPIYLDFDAQMHCLSATTLQTEWLLEGDAVLQSNGVMLFSTPSLSPATPISSTDEAESARAYSGSVQFGVSCGLSSIKIDVEGLIETASTAYDWLEIYANGVFVKRWESTQVLYNDISNVYPSPAGHGTFDVGDGTYTRPYDTEFIEDSFTIPLTATPCGNVIEIRASTEDKYANHAVYWYAEWTNNG